MAGIMEELSHVEAKMKRAAVRSNSLHKKRQEYKRSCQVAQNESGLPWLRDGERKPHRLARTATRTLLARGMLETGADMPAVSLGRAGRSTRGSRKPSISPLMMCTAAEGDCDFLDLHDLDDFSLTAMDSYDLISSPADSEDEPMARAVHAYTVFDLLQGKISKLSSESQVRKRVVLMDCSGSAAEPQSDSVMSEDDTEVRNMSRTSTEQESQSDSVTSEVDEVQGMSHASTEASLGEVRVKEQLSAKANSAEGVLFQHKDDDLERRKAVLRSVLAAHRRDHELEMEQLREAQLRAQEAEAAAMAARSKAEKAAADAEVQLQKTKGADLKRAMQLEKQVSADLRKKRNQAAQLEALRKKADHALQESKAIKEQAEAEVVANKARLLAEASNAAQQEAAAYVEAARIEAQEEAKALVEQSREEAARIEAEVKAKAELEAQVLKMQTEAEAKALAQAELEAASKRAQEAAKEVKTAALKHVLAMKARAEEQMKAKFEAEQQARMESEAKAAQEKERQAKARAQQEAAEALRMGKLLDQQRSKTLRKQAQQERKHQELQEQALAAVRAEAAKEVDAVVAELADLKVQAHASELQLQREKKAKELAEAAAAQAQAELSKIKARSDQEAEAMKAKLEEIGSRTCLEEDALEQEVPLDHDWTIADVADECEDDSWAVLA